jgi:hypothetical protein
MNKAEDNGYDIDKNVVILESNNEMYKKQQKL